MNATEAFERAKRAAQTIEAARTAYKTRVAEIAADVRLSDAAKQDDRRAAREEFERATEGAGNDFELAAETLNRLADVYNTAFDPMDGDMLDAMRAAELLPEIGEDAAVRLAGKLARKPAALDALAAKLDKLGHSFAAEAVRDAARQAACPRVANASAAWFAARDPEGTGRELRNALADCEAVRDVLAA